MKIRISNKAFILFFATLPVVLGVISTYAAQEAAFLHHAISKGDVAAVRVLLATEAGRAQIGQEGHIY